MIEEDEEIIFVCQGRVIAISNLLYYLLVKEENSLLTGFIEKKIIVTSRRCLFF